MRLPARTLVLGDAPTAWEALGFAVSDGCMDLGGLTVALTGEGGGVVRLEIEGLQEARPDTLPLLPASAQSAPQGASEHPIGALAVDHVVALTGSLDRTVPALECAGLELRRRRDPPEAPMAQAFFNLATTILEVGEAGDPPRLWGMTIVVADIDAAVERLGALSSGARDAVQPGRRIVTLRRETGLGLPVALMSPRVRTR